MRVIVKKWGNSAAVRIPSGIMRAAQLAPEDAVDMSEQGGKIVIEPIRTSKPCLSDMLRNITSENLHTGVDFGAPVGKESL
jgi:antitoxin MazE